MPPPPIVASSESILRAHLRSYAEGIGAGGAGGSGGTGGRDVRRVMRLVESSPQPWSRDIPLHLTASALVLDSDTHRVLLRWHDRLNMWAQVGGHADPDERDPLAIALREAREETSLTDLRLSHLVLDGCGLVDVVVVADPGRPGEPAHEHADLRYLLETSSPEQARPEKHGAAVTWLSLAKAMEAVGDDNLRVTLERVRLLIGD